MGLARNLQAGLTRRALRLLPDIWPEGDIYPGGTGDFAENDAVLRQTFLGMSDNYGVRVQIELIGGAEQAAYAPPIGAAGREAENARD